MNFELLYETLAKIIGYREGVEITFKIERKENKNEEAV